MLELVNIATVVLVFSNITPVLLYRAFFLFYNPLGANHKTFLTQV